jgi:hypothetical protein
MKAHQLVFVIAITLAFVSSYVLCTHGLDLSVFQGDVSAESWKCLREKGYEFAIVQALKSNGEVNPYVVHDISRAKAAGIVFLCVTTYIVFTHKLLGFKHVDIYVFPDFSRGIGSAGSQITSAINYVRSHGESFGMVWIDIEVCSFYVSLIYRWY